MLINKFLNILIFFTCLHIPLSNNKETILKYKASETLKQHFKNYFNIGVAVNSHNIRGDESELIAEQFNSVTPENDMKWGPIHPRESEYNFKNADSIVAFAHSFHMKIRGHNLCWHNQTPRWVFYNSNGSLVSKDTLLQRLKDHINKVVSRYKGQVYAWDVVNEAISDKPDEYLRNSEWFKICGEEYIAKAFQYAHEADPKALLFYNDYNEINATKREKIFKLVMQLKKEGIPINGIGLQGHWAINEPSKDQLDSTLKRFAETGLILQITELDISVYPKEHNARARRAEDHDTAFSAEREQKQIDSYKMCFSLFKKYRKNIKSVTFWNVSDRHSWLDNFPVIGRKDHPLLFDRNLKPKKVFFAVMND